MLCFCFFKQKTAYEMRISDWSSDVCSSDLGLAVVDGDDAAPVHAPGNLMLVLAGRDAGVALDAALGVAEEFHSCHFSAPPLTPALRGKVWFCFPACRSPRRSRRCPPCCWTHPSHRDRRPSDTCDGDPPLATGRRSGRACKPRPCRPARSPSPSPT